MNNVAKQARAAKSNVGDSPSFLSQGPRRNKLNTWTTDPAKKDRRRALQCSRERYSTNILNYFDMDEYNPVDTLIVDKRMSNEDPTALDEEEQRNYKRSHSA